MADGFVAWLTGLSGAGKSTIAARLADELARRGVDVEVLDGDEVRRNLSAGLGYTREDRDANVRRIAWVAGLLARHGVGVVTAAISPYADTRDEVRAATPNCAQVYVDAPVEVCAERDVKGLYAKARAGEIPAFTGVSDPYEPPPAPDVHVRTDREDVEASVQRIVDHLAGRGWVAPR